MATLGTDWDPLDPRNFEIATDAASAQGSESILDPSCNCARNWVKIRYEYEDGTGVPGANYIVQSISGDGTASGDVLAEGTTDANGDAHAILPDGIGDIEFYFFDDPEGEPYEDPEAGRPLEEPEPGFWARLWDNISEGADWVWGVIQGDFNEDASTSQIIARMILTMIPGIDQLADVQDIINILYKLVWKQEWDQIGHWVLLVITLIGLIPVLGSLAKGLLKLLMRKAGDLSALRSLYGICNFFGKMNAHRWLRDFASKLTGEYLQAALDILDVMMTRVAAYMAGARANFLFRRWNGIIDDGLAKVAQFRSIAPEKLRQAADYLKDRLLSTLAAAMTRLGRGRTKNTDPHVLRQNVEQPPVRAPRHPRTQEEYDALARDPSHNHNETAGSIAERDVGLGLEDQGDVPGPIVRDPTGGAEFIDADGVEWDVKAYNSNFPNGFDPSRIQGQLDMSQRLGENVMMDTRNLSASDLSALSNIVADNGYENIVLFWP